MLNNPTFFTFRRCLHYRRHEIRRYTDTTLENMLTGRVMCKYEANEKLFSKSAYNTECTTICKAKKKLPTAQLSEKGDSKSTTSQLQINIPRREKTRLRNNMTENSIKLEWTFRYIDTLVLQVPSVIPVAA